MAEAVALTKEEMLARLLSLPRAAILIHRNPDGDCVGSGVALCRFLAARGAEVSLLSPDPIPERLAFLCEGVPICREEAPACIVSVDVASLSQCGRLASAVEQAEAVLSIDHHERSTPFGAHYTVGEASSAGEVIYDLLTAGNLPLSPEVATPLYAAIASDTGGFRFANVSPATHQAAAALLACRIDAAAVNHALFESKSDGQLAAEGYAAGHSRQYYGGRLSVLAISSADCRDIGCTDEDFNSAIDILRSRRSVEIAALLREKADGSFRLSLRSQGADVAAFCAALGGGGHRRAAGCTLAGTDIEKIERQLVRQLGDSFFA